MHGAVELIRVQVAAERTSRRTPGFRATVGGVGQDGGMDSEDAPDDRPEEPWVMPGEYEIGGVRWFSDASREMARALHPLLAQVTR